MSALIELAERCEKATGPDRELDLAIAHASYDHGFPIFGERVNYDPALWLERYGPITASLDAAMTLVPEHVSVLLFVAAKRTTRAVLAGNGEEVSDANKWEALAATPALALCAAVLRARAAQ